MAEFVGRMLLAVVEVLLDVLFERTGRKILSLLALNPNSFFNYLVGLVFWVVFGCALVGIVAGVIERHS